MTVAEPPEEPKGGAMSFRKSSPNRPKLPKEEAKRQGEITLLAFTLLGGRDQALAFLNHPNSQLGGRPLDVAMANQDGFLAVEQEIRRLAAQQED